MFTEIKLFNGGVNTTIAPHFINQNQAVYVANADISNGDIWSAKEVKTTGESLSGNYATYYKSQDEVVSSTEDRSYVEWAGMLYWSNSAGAIKRYDGTNTLAIGNHTAPNAAPTLTEPSSTAGLLSGTYTYCITYTHDDIFESPPSAFIPITTTTTTCNVLVTFTDTSVPATATHRNIYRAGGLNPTFNLVATTAIEAATYTDNIHDFDISRTELKTNDNNPAPTNLDMLIESEGTFFGSLGDKVYFSKEGQPEYWSDYNFVTLPTEVTGLGVLGAGVVAFTSDSMYMVLGKNISNVSLTKLPYDYGCKDKRTVKNIDGRLVWVSALDDRDAICTYDGSTVQIIDKFDKWSYLPSIGNETTFADFTSEQYDSYTFDIQGAIVSNRKYFLFLDGRTAIVDVENELKVYYMTESIDTSYSKNNNLYVSKANSVYEYYPDASTYRDIVYRTGDFDNGDLTKQKHYRSIKFNGSGTFTIGVYVDDVRVASVDTNKTFLPAGTYGNRISFLIESTGYANIKSITYEYNILKD